MCWASYLLEEVRPSVHERKGAVFCWRRRYLHAGRRVCLTPMTKARSRAVGLLSSSARLALAEVCLCACWARVNTQQEGGGFVLRNSVFKLQNFSLLSKTRDGGGRVWRKFRGRQKKKKKKKRC